MTELGAPTIDHGSTRAGRWLRARRLKIAAWIAVIEGLLVVVHVISWWPAVALAALVIGFYALLGRHSRSDTVRQASWVGAASQALMIAIPVFFALFATVAIILLAVVAVVALIILFTDRD